MPPVAAHPKIPQLNAEQQRVAEHFHGRALVIAGPGSGKTSTITARVEAVEELGSEILVHFSIDAARVSGEGPSDDEQLERVRREAHTIKGAASSLGLLAIRDACITVESSSRAADGVAEAVAALAAAVAALPDLLTGSPYTLPKD